MTFKHLLLVFLSSLILSFALYGNTIKGEFVYDDSFFSGRSELHDASYLGRIWSESLRPNEPKAELYRPLTVSSFALSFIFFGDSPISFHIVNIILNAITVFLVYVVCYQLFGEKNKYLPVFTALIFAFLPIHTEAVANIKSRDNVLSALFILLSTSVFLRSIVGFLVKAKEKINYKLILLTSFFLFISYFAMEYAITAPFFLLFLFFVLKSPKFKDLAKIGFIFLVPLAVYLFIRFRVLGIYAFFGEPPYWYDIPTYYYSLTERVSTAFKMAAMYVQETFIPYNLSATHHFNHLIPITNPFASLEGVLGILILFILLVLMLHRKTRKTPLGVGSLMFLSSYFIFSKFVFKGGENFAERWMYFPSFGLSLILAYFLEAIFMYKKVLGIALLVIILSVYGVITFNRNKVWLSEVSLYESMIRDAPNSVQGYLGLSYHYIYERDYRRSEYYMLKGKKILPDHPRLLNIEAAINVQKKRYPEAEAAAKKSIEVFPAPISYMLYAIILTEQAKYEESLAIATEYMNTPFYKDDRNRSLNVAVNYITAVNLKGLGRADEAKNYFDLTKPLEKVNPL